MTSAVHAMSSSIVKLPFNILAVSGYEESYPAESLTDHSNHSQGWQTERFCIFPQSIILAFNFGKCRIRKIQLLIHEYKIPKRIQLFAGNIDQTKPMLKDQPDIEFKSLGLIDLCDNSNHSYRSRELKSIHVDFEATHLKMVLNKNYINVLNLYNQVGIVAVNLLGEVMDTNYMIKTMSETNGLYYGLVNKLDKDSLVNGFINHDLIDTRIPFLHDLSFDYHQDVKMIRFIAAVSDAKLEAVRIENFEVAKALKTVLNNSKIASSRIIKIQMEKEKYILNEDYDQAQICKTEIEEIKLSLIKELQSFGLDIDHNGVIYSTDKKDSVLVESKSVKSSKADSLNADLTCTTSSLSSIVRPLSDSLQEKLTETPIVVPDGKVDTEKLSSALSSTPNLDAVIPQETLKIVGTNDKNANLEIPNQPQKIPILTRTGSPMLPAQQKLLEAGLNSTEILEKPQSPIEKKSKPESSVPVSIITRTGSPILPAQQKLLNQPQEQFQKEDKKLYDTSKADTKNTPKDLTEPDALSTIQMEQFSTCIDIFQLFAVQHTLSINFKNREFGLAEISDKLVEWNKNRNSSDIDLLSISKATIQLTAHCLEDSREKSSLQTLNVLDQLFEILAQEGGKDSLILNNVVNLLPLLISKAGETNPRIKSKSSDILKKMMGIYHKPPNSILPELLKPFDQKKGGIINPKIVKSRLEILNFAISEYGISDKDPKFSSTSITSFIKPFIDNTNTDVRDLAYTIMAQICITLGDSFPKESTNFMRDAQKEILSKKINSLGGLKPTPAASSKSSKSAKSKTKSKDSKESRKESKSDKNLDTIDTKDLKTQDIPVKAVKSKKTTFSDKSIADSKTDKDSKETCLFCEKSIPKTLDGLEEHYAKDCPYLVRCPQCNLIVEIIQLQTHMYGSCELAPSDPKSCDQCHLLVPLVDYTSHRSKKKCKIWNIDHDPSICGLCKKSIMGKSGWKIHVSSDKKCIAKRQSKKIK